MTLIIKEKERRVQLGEICLSRSGVRKDRLMCVREKLESAFRWCATDTLIAKSGLPKKGKAGKRPP